MCVSLPLDVSDNSVKLCISLNTIYLKLIIDLNSYIETFSNNSVNKVLKNQQIVG